MTPVRTNIRNVAVAGFVFAAVLAVLTLVNRAPSGTPGGQLPAPPDSVPRRAGAQDRIARLQARIATGNAKPRAYTELGDAFVQRNRETGDAALLARAEEAYSAALARDRRDVSALTGLGALAAARHDFATALRRGREARRIAPESLVPYPVLVDAQVELGRYGAARRTLQEMIDLKPGLAAYARVSYFRELSGDLPGAADALELAVSAGGSTPENTAYVQTLLGNLEFVRGRLGPAARAYEAALRSLPAYAPAGAGLASVEAARGDLRGAIARLRAVVDRLPLPQYAIALAEAELAAGRDEEAAADLDVVRAEQRLLARNGVDTDVELAVFEADHGDPGRAVELARRGWRAAPSVRAADAYGWALTRSGRPEEGLAWARRALRLGSRDPLFRYHAGIAAKEAGRPGAARRLLRDALALNPRFSPLHAPRARRALEGLE